MFFIEKKKTERHCLTIISILDDGFGASWKKQDNGGVQWQDKKNTRMPNSQGVPVIDRFFGKIDSADLSKRILNNKQDNKRFDFKKSKTQQLQPFGPRKRAAASPRRVFLFFIKGRKCIFQKSMADSSIFRSKKNPLTKTQRFPHCKLLILLTSSNHCNTTRLLAIEPRTQLSARTS